MAALLFIPNPTGTATGAAVCFGATSTTITLSNLVGSPNQYQINFDDPAITDINSFTNIPGGNVIGITIPGNLAAATYTGTITLYNSTSTCTGTAPFSFIVNPLPVFTLEAAQLMA